jgi:hypothetical protein
VVDESRPAARQAAPPGPRPALGELQRSHCWTWVYCEKCLHHAPMALVPLIIRWGVETRTLAPRPVTTMQTCAHHRLRGAGLRTFWSGAGPQCSLRSTDTRDYMRRN